MDRTLTFRGRLPGVVCEAALPPPRENLLRLDVTAFVGFAERGPLDTPVALEDISQYRAVFGNDVPLARTRQGTQIVYANMLQAVQTFFDNGGRRCYAVRVAGDGARANHFHMPGLIALNKDTQTLQPVLVPAAWAGSWSDTMSIGTQLLSQPLRLTKSLDTWTDDADIPLEVPTVTTVQHNDLLRLHFAGPGKPIVFCYVDNAPQNSNVAGNDVGSYTTRGIPITAHMQAGTTQVFTNNLQTLPQIAQVGLQGKDGRVSISAQNITLTELPDLEDGYVLSMTTSAVVKQGDVLSVDFVGGDALVFPVEQTVGTASTASDTVYHLTSRTTSWRLTPSKIERLTEKGWETLDVKFAAQGLEKRLGGYSLHLVDADQARIQALIRRGDVLRVTYLQQSLVLSVSDVSPQPSITPTSALTVGTDVSRPAGGTITPASALTEVRVTSREALWQFSKLPAAGASPPGPNALGPYGKLVQVDLLNFDLFVREEQLIVETWSNLQFAYGPNTANSWLDRLVSPPNVLQTEIAYPGTSQRNIPGLDPTQSARLGVPDPIIINDGGEVKVAQLLYYPLCMGDLPGPDEFASMLPEPEAAQATHPTPPVGKNGLDTFADPRGLFLDGRLATVGVRDLINEANAILYLNNDKQELKPLRGIHSLLMIDEVGLIALPDLAQRRWAGIGDDPPNPAEPPPPPPPPRDWTYFQACALPVHTDTPPKGDQSHTRRWDALPIIESADDYQPDELQALLDVQHALVNLCAARADVVAVLSLPMHFKRREVLDWQRLFTGIEDFLDGSTLSYAAVYHPWLQVREDITPDLAPLRSVPPDGAVCGMIAARELARGPWIAPANVPLLGVLGLSSPLTTADWTDLFNAQINIVRQQPGKFILLSAHTLSFDLTFLQISVRRLLIFLRKLAIQRGMRYVFEANNERFRQRVQTSFEATLTTLATRGALTAFEVVTNSEINTPNDYDNGRFLIALKIAPTLPIEFITVVLLRAGEGLLEVVER
ncbi:MAG: hypothetical protein NVS4B11_29380 [Ktedonobacteraceae bacterium]